MDRLIVSVDLSTNHRITAVPQPVGAMVTICTGDGETPMLKHMFFETCDDMMRSLKSTYDDCIIRKLSKAF